MEEIRTVLAVIGNRDDGEIVLEKAVHVARVNDASLHVIRIIYEGFVDLAVHTIEKSQELKSWVLQGEEAFLEDLIDPWRNQIAHLEAATLWNKSEWEAIVDAANHIKANLIIKPTEYPVAEIVRTPQDWNLLRHADMPVMLVKPINWSDRPRIAAAVDATDPEEEALNVRILREARKLASSLGGELRVVTAFPSVEHWMGPITIAIDFDQVRTGVARQIEDEIGKLAGECGIEMGDAKALEGVPGEVIKKELDQWNADILVMGTRARRGAAGIILGNTSESIIHEVNTDVVVLR